MRNPVGGAVVPPTASIAFLSGVPNGSSYNPGQAQRPPSVIRNVPGDRPVPAARKASAPIRASTDRLARVSTFDTSVGRPATPDSYGRGGLSVGFAGPPLR